MLNPGFRTHPPAGSYESILKAVETAKQGKKKLHFWAIISSRNEKLQSWGRSRQIIQVTEAQKQWDYWNWLAEVAHVLMPCVRGICVKRIGDHKEALYFYGAMESVLPLGNELWLIMEWSAVLPLRLEFFTGEQFRKSKTETLNTDLWDTQDLVTARTDKKWQKIFLLKKCLVNEIQR